MKAGWVIAALLAVLVVPFWIRWHDAEVRATAALVAKDHAVDALADTVTALSTAFADERKRADSLIARLTIKAGADSILSDSLKSAGLVRYIELRAIVPPLAVALLDTLALTHQREVDALHARLAAVRTINATLLTERTRRDSVDVKRNELEAGLTAQRDAWKKRASRKDWISCGPGVAVTTAGAGVGVSCHVNLL